MPYFSGVLLLAASAFMFYTLWQIHKSLKHIQMSLESISHGLDTLTLSLGALVSAVALELERRGELQLEPEQRRAMVEQLSQYRPALPPATEVSVKEE